jgi:protein-tyrosine phosphatase
MSFMDMDLIEEKLYLGTYLAACNRKGLQEAGITHILTVGYDMKPKHSDCITYKVIEIHDEPSDIIQYFDECVEFILQAMKTGVILVHCAAGISRSVTIVTAYLMNSRKLSHMEALKFVQSKRQRANPITAFQDQLKIYYECGFKNDGNFSKKYKESIFNTLQSLEEKLDIIEKDINDNSIIPDTTKLYEIQGIADTIRGSKDIVERRKKVNYRINKLLDKYYS